MLSHQEQQQQQQQEEEEGMEDQVAAAAGDVGTASTNERVCYVHCNFCNTVLAVSVPSSSMYTMVTVRCGHCANLLSVNMASFMGAPPPSPTPSLYPTNNNNNNSSFLPNPQPNAATAASLPHQAEKEPLGFEEGLSNTNVNNNSSSKDCGGSTSGSSSSSKYSSSGSSSNNSGKQQQVVVAVSPPSPSLEYSWVDNHHLHEPPRLPPIRREY
ncbi:unnamed protein product [Linum tenue]|uniref:YABBY N-terminal domain-containing protein n=1 Tax=Linum tenue TaxID=586396 RepID=A0AAV0Q7X8_9ROSI|nr:unnamed protein product [Linum tenue]